MTCPARNAFGTGPLVCTLPESHPFGHVFQSSTASDLGEGIHHAPEGDLS